jgi:Protein kinase domain
VTNRPGDDPTIAPSLDATAPPGSEPGRLPPPPSRRFVPGSIIAGRYRLVALLGRGGMGEVYRADDLTLDHPVALKFLPELPGYGEGADSRLAQLYSELRLARQVSHKNVCRLFDLGEAGGRRFLTMEYVDGEDLASLLRRIGRIPQDKAIAIARQLCAGVSAAHERGVLHRDLKPANVMLDGEGDVRITDFGLAVAAGDVAAIRAGTPQYMAPEQLAGQPATVSTDIYALALILFEIFTGRRAHDAKTLPDLMEWHQSGTVTTPSSLVPDLDPSIERVILRCLSKDPQHRPGSALAVAAALPGGDPLAAALAAGETPSPEMLVAAGEVEALPLRRAALLLGILAAALAVYAALSPRATIAALVPLDRPPAALADRAAQVAVALGYLDQPADETYGLSLPGDYPRWIASTSADPRRWDALAAGAPPAMVLWYRSSPRALAPLRATSDVTMVTLTDPPPTDSNMRTVIVDTRGRLQEFHAVPPQRDPDAASPAAPRWDALFDAAGLPMATFAASTPEWTPRDFADTRAAWEGPMPGRSDIRLRVEAAAYRGRPVSFVIVGPWSRASRIGALPQTRLAAILGTFGLMFWMSGLLVSAVIARHNLRTNRADRRSAARLAVAFVIAQIAGWVVANHHVPDVNLEFLSLFKALSSAGFAGGFLWVLYLALEPYGRRFWSDGLLGWTRLLSGRVADPRVGRDVLVGCALGAGFLMVDLLHQLAPRAIGAPPAIPLLGQSVRALVSNGWLSLDWIQQTYNSVQSALLIILVFVALRLLTKRTWPAIAIGIVVVAAASNGTLSPGGNLWIDAVFAVAAMGLITFGIFRFGLLATIVMLAVENLTTTVPFTGHVFHWSATPGIATLALVLALGLFGVRAARTGQPLFGG